MFGFARKATPEKIREIRYAIEHQMFRHHFYNNTPGFLYALMKNKDGLFELYDGVFKHERIKNPYSKEDFIIRKARMDAETMMICAELPEPECMPLCYRVYFLLDPKCERLSLYTIEKSMEGGFLCGWDQDTHLNYRFLVNPKFEKNKGFFLATECYIIYKMYSERFGQNANYEQKEDKT